MFQLRTSSFEAKNLQVKTFKNQIENLQRPDVRPFAILNELSLIEIQCQINTGKCILSFRIAGIFAGLRSVCLMKLPVVKDGILASRLARRPVSCASSKISHTVIAEIRTISLVDACFFVLISFFLFDIFVFIFSLFNFLKQQNLCQFFH